MKTSTSKIFYCTVNIVDQYDIPSEDFIRQNYPNFNRLTEFFGEDIVFEAIEKAGVKIVDFMDKQYVSEDIVMNYINRGYYFADNKVHYFNTTKWKGDWSKEVKTKGYCVLEKAKYFRKGVMVYRNCLYAMFPYLKKFDNELRIYSVNGYSSIEEDYIYLTVADKSEKHSGTVIYIKPKRLKESNMMGIIEDHTNYFVEYYKWPGNWGINVEEEDVLSWREKQISLLYMPKAFKFFEEMEKYKLKNSDTSWMDNI